MSEVIEAELQPIPDPYELYRHYKGGEYLVLAIGEHTETKEKMVVYASLSFGTIWTRPLNVWNQFVVTKVWNPSTSSEEERVTPRFLKIERRTK